MWRSSELCSMNLLSGTIVNEIGKPARPSGTDDNNLLADRHGMVIGLASFRHKCSFVLEKTPRMIGADLVSAARNADNAAAMGKFERSTGMNPGFQGVSLAQKFILLLV